MTRFLYIADTHLGATSVGYQQQKRYPDKLPEILTALTGFLSPEQGVDFVLHGGDMVDATSVDNILTAVELFDLPVPVFLCLGNHDLTVPDAVKQWLELAPCFFKDGKPDFTITTEDCVIHVAPNHWGDLPFYWSDNQEARLSVTQIEHLSAQLSTKQHLPHIVLTHSPVYGLPVEQTGFSEPYHAPNRSFTECLTSLVTRHEKTKCVLGAHNHLNMRVHHEGVEFVTASSLIETPFEFKIFEVTPRSIAMKTVSLNESLAFEGDYDATKSFVQGGTAERSFRFDG